MCAASVATLIVLTAGASAWLVGDWWMDAPPPRLCVLDPALIMTGGLIHPGSGEQGYTEAFSRRMTEMLERFNADGMVVITREALAAYPPDIDITERMAKALDIDLAAARDYIERVNRGELPQRPGSTDGP